MTPTPFVAWLQGHEQTCYACWNGLAVVECVEAAFHAGQRAQREKDAKMILTHNAHRPKAKCCWKMPTKTANCLSQAIRASGGE